MEKIKIINNLILNVLLGSGKQIKDWIKPKDLSTAVDMFTKGEINYYGLKDITLNYGKK
jgi:hypothetical protein